MLTIGADRRGNVSGFLSVVSVAHLTRTHSYPPLSKYEPQNNRIHRNRNKLTTENIRICSLLMQFATLFEQLQTQDQFRVLHIVQKTVDNQISIATLNSSISSIPFLQYFQY